MLAWMTAAGLGAAVPYAIKTGSEAEWAIYMAVAERAVQIKAQAKGAL